MGTSMPEGEIPQIPDQEKFLKEHFGTLSNTDGKGISLYFQWGDFVTSFLTFPLYKPKQALSSARLSWMCVFMGRGEKMEKV